MWAVSLAGSNRASTDGSEGEDWWWITWLCAIICSRHLVGGAGDGDRLVNNDTDGCDSDDNSNGDGDGDGTAMKEARMEKKGGAKRAEDNREEEREEGGGS